MIFDGEGGGLGRQTDKVHKAGRVDFILVAEQDSPFSQRKDAKRALDAMNIRWAEPRRAETDEILSGRVHTCQHTLDIPISSWDSDFLQLAAPGVTQLMYHGKARVRQDEAAVLRYTEIQYRPRQLAAYTALLGDKSDNLPGGPGVGPKTAARLLKQYGSLEQTFTHIPRMHPCA